jgi:hypothetical protein
VGIANVAVRRSDAARVLDAVAVVIGLSSLGECSGGGPSRDMKYTAHNNVNRLVTGVMREQRQNAPAIR